MSTTDSRYQQSITRWEESKHSVIPGSSTISKRADLYPFGAYPVYLTKAQGAEVIDLDGHHYIDFQSALGAILLGVNHPHVKKTMLSQLDQGNLFSLSHPAVIQLAEKIVKHIPCAERVRLLKNGSDATTGAVRIARAYTGREKILACHYHGWHDWYYVSTGMNAGIPGSMKDYIVPFPYNDLDEFKKLLTANEGQIAAVIMEPTHLDAPSGGYLAELKRLTHEAGVVLIFDEVVTGFRFGLGGAQAYFGITPDLSCFGKALGNGSPISLIAGKLEIMEATSHVVTTQTYGEDCLAIAAAIATIEVMEKEKVVDTVWRLGKQFQDGYNTLAQQYGIDSQCIGYPVRMQIEFSDRGSFSSLFLRSYLLQETAKDGFLIAHMIFINHAHTQKHITDLLASIERIFKNLAERSESDISLTGQLAVDLW